MAGAGGRYEELTGALGVLRLMLEAAEAAEATGNRTARLTALEGLRAARLLLEAALEALPPPLRFGDEEGGGDAGAGAERRGDAGDGGGAAG